MPEFKYRAFLSYSHRDTAWAKWLHRALEGYRVEKDLVGRATTHGAAPKTLRPIFRDRDDFSAGHSLSDQSLAALQASQFLVVICSPNAARSRYVDQEIASFKALGRAAQVILIIVDGEPGDAERECFPPSARLAFDQTGQPTGEREEPIAADARPQGDGKELAKLKVVAALLGLPLDEIVRRARRARRRRIAFQIGAAGSTVVLIAMAALGWTAMEGWYAKYLVVNDLNLVRDAADVCENAASKLTDTRILEQRRIRLASECIQTFSEILTNLPPRTTVPQTVVISFERYLPALRAFGSADKLSAQQVDVLRQAEALAARLRLPIAQAP